MPLDLFLGSLVVLCLAVFVIFLMTEVKKPTYQRESKQDRGRVDSKG